MFSITFRAYILKEKYEEVWESRGTKYSFSEKIQCTSFKIHNLNLNTLAKTMVTFWLPFTHFPQFKHRFMYIAKLVHNLNNNSKKYNSS